jgi:hypothetical protein
MRKVSMDHKDKSAVREFEKRQQPRYALHAGIKVETRTRGTVIGDTVDISQTGISALLMEQISLEEVVRLDFLLSSAPVTVYAAVRQRGAFRYGFQFLGLETTKSMIGFACRQIAVNEILESIETM